MSNDAIGLDLDQIRALATMWTDLGNALFTGAEGLQNALRDSGWSGAAANEAMWGLEGVARVVVPTSGSCWRMGDVISQYADQIQKALHDENQAAEISALVTIGGDIVQAVFAFFAPELEGLIGAVVSAVVDAAASFAAEAVAAAVATAVRFATGAVINAGLAIGTQVALTAGAEAIAGKSFSADDIDWGQTAATIALGMAGEHAVGSSAELLDGLSDKPLGETSGNVLGKGDAVSLSGDTVVEEVPPGAAGVGDLTAVSPLDSAVAGWNAQYGEGAPALEATAPDSTPSSAVAEPEEIIRVGSVSAERSPTVVESSVTDVGQSAVVEGGASSSMSSDTISPDVSSGPASSQASVHGDGSSIGESSVGADLVGAQSSMRTDPGASSAVLDNVPTSEPMLSSGNGPISERAQLFLASRARQELLSQANSGSGVLDASGVAAEADPRQLTGATYQPGTSVGGQSEPAVREPGGGYRLGAGEPTEFSKIHNEMLSHHDLTPEQLMPVGDSEPGVGGGGGYRLGSGEPTELGAIHQEMVEHHRAVGDFEPGVGGGGGHGPGTAESSVASAGSATVGHGGPTSSGASSGSGGTGVGGHPGGGSDDGTVANRGNGSQTQVALPGSAQTSDGFKSGGSVYQAGSPDQAAAQSSAGTAKTFPGIGYKLGSSERVIPAVGIDDAVRGDLSAPTDLAVKTEAAVADPAVRTNVQISTDTASSTGTAAASGTAAPGHGDMSTATPTGEVGGRPATGPSANMPSSPPQTTSVDSATTVDSTSRASAGAAIGTVESSFARPDQRTGLVVDPRSGQPLGQSVRPSPVTPIKPSRHEPPVVATADSDTATDNGMAGYTSVPAVPDHAAHDSGAVSSADDLIAGVGTPDPTSHEQSNLGATPAVSPSHQPAGQSGVSPATGGGANSAAARGASSTQPAPVPTPSRKLGGGLSPEVEAKIARQHQENIVRNTARWAVQERAMLRADLAVIPNESAEQLSMREAPAGWQGGPISEANAEQFRAALLDNIDQRLRSSINPTSSGQQFMPAVRSEAYNKVASLLADATRLLDTVWTKQSILPTAAVDDFLANVDRYDKSVMAIQASLTAARSAEQITQVGHDAVALVEAVKDLHNMVDAIAFPAPGTGGMKQAPRPIKPKPVSRYSGVSPQLPRSAVIHGPQNWEASYENGSWKPKPKSLRQHLAQFRDVTLRSTAAEDAMVRKWAMIKWKEEVDPTTGKQFKVTHLANLAGVSRTTMRDWVRRLDLPVVEDNNEPSKLMHATVVGPEGWVATYNNRNNAVVPTTLEDYLKKHYSGTHDQMRALVRGWALRALEEVNPLTNKFFTRVQVAALVGSAPATVRDWRRQLKAQTGMREAFLVGAELPWPVGQHGELTYRNVNFVLPRSWIGLRVTVVDDRPHGENLAPGDIVIFTSAPNPDRHVAVAITADLALGNTQGLNSGYIRIPGYYLRRVPEFGVVNVTNRSFYINRVRIPFKCFNGETITSGLFRFVRDGLTVRIYTLDGFEIGFGHIPSLVDENGNLLSGSGGIPGRIVALATNIYEHLRTMSGASGTWSWQVTQDTQGPHGVLGGYSLKYWAEEDDGGTIDLDQPRVDDDSSRLYEFSGVLPPRWSRDPTAHTGVVEINNQVYILPRDAQGKNVIAETDPDLQEKLAARGLLSLRIANEPAARIVFVRPDFGPAGVRITRNTGDGDAYLRGLPRKGVRFKSKSQTMTINGFRVASAGMKNITGIVSFERSGSQIRFYSLYGNLLDEFTIAAPEPDPTKIGNLGGGGSRPDWTFQIDGREILVPAELRTHDAIPYRLYRDNETNHVILEFDRDNTIDLDMPEVDISLVQHNIDSSFRPIGSHSAKDDTSNFRVYIESMQEPSDPVDSEQPVGDEQTPIEHSATSPVPLEQPTIEVTGPHGWRASYTLNDSGPQPKTLHQHLQYTKRMKRGNFRQVIVSWAKSQAQQINPVSQQEFGFDLIAILAGVPENTLRSWIWKYQESADAATVNTAGTELSDAVSSAGKVIYEGVAFQLPRAWFGLRVAAVDDRLPGAGLAPGNIVIFTQIDSPEKHIAVAIADDLERQVTQGRAKASRIPGYYLRRVPKFGIGTMSARKVLINQTEVSLSEFGFAPRGEVTVRFVRDGINIRLFTLDGYEFDRGTIPTPRDANGNLISGSVSGSSRSRALPEFDTVEPAFSRRSIGIRNYHVEQDINGPHGQLGGYSLVWSSDGTHKEIDLEVPTTDSARYREFFGELPFRWSGNKSAHWGVVRVADQVYILPVELSGVPVQVLSDRQIGKNLEALGLLGLEVVGKPDSVIVFVRPEYGSAGYRTPQGKEYLQGVPAIGVAIQDRNSGMITINDAEIRGQVTHGSRWIDSIVKFERVGNVLRFTRLNGERLPEIQIDEITADPAKFFALKRNQATVQVGVRRVRVPVKNQYAVNQQKYRLIRDDKTGQLVVEFINPFSRVNLDVPDIDESVVQSSLWDGIRPSAIGESTQIAASRMPMTADEQEAPTIDQGGVGAVLGSSFLTSQLNSLAITAADEDTSMAVDAVSTVAAASEDEAVGFQVGRARFTNLTQALLPVNPGQHRRHIIPSHVFRMALNAWLNTHYPVGHPLHGEKSQWARSWQKFLDNHLPNLWVGPGVANTVAGGIAHTLESAAQSIETVSADIGPAASPMESVQRALADIERATQSDANTWSLRPDLQRDWLKGPLEALPETYVDAWMYVKELQASAEFDWPGGSAAEFRVWMDAYLQFRNVADSPEEYSDERINEWLIQFVNLSRSGEPAQPEPTASASSMLVGAVIDL